MIKSSPTHHHHMGSNNWVLSGGHIPLTSTGIEPGTTSRDQFTILNTGPQQAAISLTIFYTDKDPVGPYTLNLAAQRMRTIRVNDLIDPEPVALDTEYVVLLQCNQPVVADFYRFNSQSGNIETLRLGATPL